ncbi:hypothetical protein [Pseudomonas sp. 22 E 5]|uniref:hypothetical protein n=1 Tax=Pseudomonas sp. 58 R 3 TaxID=1844108 RepID=UPI000812BBAB|nr:hypothetical protein [Pseudomonas sp. 58 R 3]CRM36235.1 hypothetical protein [Pseudomonas sp. 58 R 3]CRM67319.1 hypothetical protein [Pseudomonas sp. 22 E 5]
MPIKKSNDQANSDDASILILRDGKARLVKPSNLRASLRDFSVITDGAGSLTAEYGNTLFPREAAYEFSFPRDIDKHRGNIDYRDESGNYFIAPTSGKFMVISKDAGSPNTYTNYITYMNLTFVHEEMEVTINGTGEATFVFA